MTDATPRRVVEHPFDRQRRAFLGIPGLVLLAALFATGGAATGVEMRNAAVADYEAAVAAQTQVAEQVEDAIADYTAKAGELSAIADAVQRITALSGEPIPPDATAALDDARQAAVQATDRPAFGIGRADDSLDGLTIPEIRARTADLGVKTESMKALGDQMSAASADVDSASAALGKALGDYITAVVQHGADLVKAHPQAGQDQVDAFRSAIDALPDTETDALPDVLRAAIAAAAKLG